MPLTEYLRILLRRGWILVLLAVLTAASAFVFSRLQTPVYQSTVSVLIAPARSDLGLTQSAKTLLDSYVAYINTDRIAQRVIDELQLDTVPQALRGDVRIASDLQSFLVRIEVENENGDLANDIARAWAVQLVQWRNDENQKQRREDRVEALILDEPVYSLDRPRTSINTLAGAILGALIGGLVIFVLEWLEAGIIRNTTDVERQLGLSVLGTIPSSKEG